MKVLVVLSAMVACALAGPGLISPLAYGALGLPAIPYSGLLGSHVASPLAYSSLVAPVGLRTQYHAQDELGQASYGHAEPLQTHNAVQDAAGNKVGSYSYVAPTGEVVRADYVADALGYRVASNALPVGPANFPIGPVPAVVADTPEVVAARVAHFAEVAAVKSRSRRALPASTAPLAYSAPLTYSHPIATPLTYSAGIAAPLAYSSGIAAPLAYSSGIGAPLAYSSGIAAPLAYSSGIAHPFAYSAGIASPLAYTGTPVSAVRAATLTRVVNTPGHAVSYRVD